MHLIQEDLDRNLNEWNLHYIRKQSHQPTNGGEIQHGKPQIMFKYPEVFGSTNKGLKIGEEKAKIIESHYNLSDPSLYCCKAEFMELILDNGATEMVERKPQTIDEAKNLFISLILLLENNLI